MSAFVPVVTLPAPASEPMRSCAASRLKVAPLATVSAVLVDSAPVEPAVRVPAATSVAPK